MTVWDFDQPFIARAIRYPFRRRNSNSGMYYHKTLLAYAIHQRCQPRQLLHNHTTSHRCLFLHSFSMNLFLFLTQRSFDACKATLPPLLVSLMPALVETLRKQGRRGSLKHIARVAPECSCIKVWSKVKRYQRERHEQDRYHQLPRKRMGHMQRSGSRLKIDRLHTKDC
jgi:hypothetical protein